MFSNVRNWFNQPFNLLDVKRNRWFLIFSTGLFVIFFMNVYTPFNVVGWYKDADIPLFATLSSFGIIGMILLVFTEFVMRPLLGIHSFSRFTYAIWFAFELLLLSSVMYLIYGQKGLAGIELFEEYLLAFRYTLLVILIPYALVLFYLYHKITAGNIDQVEYTAEHLIKIRDENGKLQLAIDFDQILFIQSTDNYVTVFFTREDKVNKELVRTSLKRLEKELMNTPIIRCHRSYMVNFEKVTVTQKSNKGLLLELKGYTAEKITVSKNYKDRILKILERKNDL